MDGLYGFPGGSWATPLSGNCANMVIFSRVLAPEWHCYSVAKLFNCYQGLTHGLDTNAFRDERLPIFLKALKRSPIFKPRILAHLDVPLLEQIIKQYEHFALLMVFKPLNFIVFLFLRLSNVLSHSIAKFDHTRQLAHGDAIFGDTGAVLLLKWSKTMQNRK